MASSELDVPDAPVCPLLGLASDRRSHFTYPHPGHRCFATGRPAEADANRQTKYCLRPDYTACDRYRARQQQAQAAGERSASRAPSRESTDSPGGAPFVASAVPGTVVHVFRTGDSLARIAKTYGLTAEQLMTANRITFNAVLADGTRLVIPLGSPPSRTPGT